MRGSKLLVGLLAASLIGLAVSMTLGTARSQDKPAEAGKLPKLPGKAPVFCIVTKVDKSSETFNFFLLFDEVVNTEKIIEDENGIVKKRTSGRVMTSRDNEKTGRPLKGLVVSTGDGRVIPRKQAMDEMPGKLVIFCEDFDGLHPTYRKMLAKDTWIIEVEKPRGLRKEDETDSHLGRTSRCSGRRPKAAAATELGRSTRCIQHG